MQKLTRRDFVKGTVAAGVTLAVPFSRVRGANDEVRLAAVGFNDRGEKLIGQFLNAQGVRIVALCDVDDHVITREVDKFKKRNEQVTVYTDYRKMMEDESIDAVCIATPDHHHVPAAALAVIAGKDVYLEKPAGHTITEGRLLVKLARKYKRIVQHGTQSRSSEGVKEALELVRSGKLGKCRMAKAIDSQRREKISHFDDEPAPSNVHYDLWLGPAPQRPFNRNRFHYNWHWWWDYGAGDIANDGVHEIDIGRWGLGVELPKAVCCSGRQLWYDDDHETPDTQTATFEYDDCYLVYEMRLWAPYRHEGVENGVIFYCDDGWVAIGRKAWEAYSADGRKVAGGSREWNAAHVENFLKAVRSRNADDLTADVKVGHYSAALAHMANIAMRVGRRLHFDSAAERFVGDAEANRYLTKEYRNGWELPQV
jgi:predicted dehydrogenase